MTSGGSLAPKIHPGLCNQTGWVQSLLCHVPAVWPQASDLITLSLSLKTRFHLWLQNTAPPAEPLHSPGKGPRVCVTVTPMASGPSDPLPNPSLSAIMPAPNGWLLPWSFHVLNSSQLLRCIMSYVYVISRLLIVLSIVLPMWVS